MQRPFMLWLLLFFLLFLGLGGLYGGIAMLIEPATGGPLQLTEILPLLPVSDFIFPGLFLLFVMGLGPLFLIYGLMVRPNWKWARILSNWSGHHWAWTGTVIFAIGVGLWLGYEGLLVGWWPITTVSAIQGGLTLLLALMPPLRRFYKN